jgi:diguanylate cyclase
MVVQLDEKIAGLQDQVKKLQSQKNSLIKELDTIEEKFEGQDRLYRKYFPVILDTVAIGESSFEKACKELSIALKKGASAVKVAYIFEQLKTAMLKEDIGPAPIKKKKGIFASLMKSSTENFVDEFKENYHEIVNKLRSTLEKKYTARLDNITASILTVSDFGEIADIRETIFNLIFAYISDTNQDRGKLNSFVQEIVVKIFDIETKLSTSYEQTNSLVLSNQGFESVLNLELSNLKKSSDVAISLDDLKIQITRR